MAKHAPKGEAEHQDTARSLSGDMEEVPQEGEEADTASADMEADSAEPVAVEAAEEGGGSTAMEKVADVMGEDEDFPNPDDFEEDIDAGGWWVVGGGWWVVGGGWCAVSVVAVSCLLAVSVSVSVDVRTIRDSLLTSSTAALLLQAPSTQTWRKMMTWWAFPRLSLLHPPPPPPPLHCLFRRQLRQHRRR